MDKINIYEFFATGLYYIQNISLSLCVICILTVIFVDCCEQKNIIKIHSRIKQISILANKCTLPFIVTSMVSIFIMYHFAK